jgi:predicted enzyme related to lactoylglutathione lyase
MNLLVNLDVEDVEAAVRFYTTALPLRVGRRFGSAGVELLGGSSPIYLLLKPAGSPASSTQKNLRSYERHWTPIHLDFVVENIESVVGAAQAAGAVLEEPITIKRWGKLAILADPFGHGFCLVEFIGRGYDEIAD